MKRYAAISREVKPGGAVLAITQQKNASIMEVADSVVAIPDVDPLMAPIVAIT